MENGDVFRSSIVPEDDDRETADGNDKQKVSRWQIGSGSLSVLEQVYAMEPFPGLETRRELSRKLNVSARQVQVWFQNKRQRERKLSRAKGLLSPPGLPDTPAVAAAAAAARAASCGSSAELVSSGSAMAPRTGCGAEAGATATVASSEADAAVTIEGSALTLSGAVSSVPLSRPAPSTKLVNPAISKLLVGGVPMTRSASLPEGSGHNSWEEGIPLPSTGRSISGLPLSSARSTSFGGIMPSCDDLDSTPLPLSQAPALSSNSVHLMRPSCMPETHGDHTFGSITRTDIVLSADRFDVDSEGGLQDVSWPVSRPSCGMPALPPSAHPGDMLGSLPWLRALQGRMPETTEQAEMHSRAAVAAAAAAMSSGGVPPRPAAAAGSLLGSGLSVGALPMLQSLLPHSVARSGSFTGSMLLHDPLGSSVIADLDLQSLQPEPRLAASLAATLGAGMDGAVDSLEDLAAIEIPDEFERDLFYSKTPSVTPTPTTNQVLNQGSRCAGQGDAGADSNSKGAELFGLLKPALKSGARMTGLPMARSGVSGLLDEMNLDVGAGLERSAESVYSDDASMETVPFREQHADAIAVPSAPHSEREMQTCASEGWRLKVGDMSCEADRYIQVITSGDEPFQIVWASEAWLHLCEYETGQVLGHTLELIQGPLTTRTSLGQLMGAIRAGDPISLSMVNHTRTGKAFSHMLRVEPLRDSRGAVQCFQATSSNIEFLDPSMQLSSMPKSTADAHDASLAPHFKSSEQPLLHSPQALEPLANAAHQGSEALKRVGSDLKISEMLDLFDASTGSARPSALSPALTTLVDDGKPAEPQWP